MLPSHVACPRCRAVLQAPPSLPAGHRLRCRRCGTPFTLGPNGAAPAVAVPADFAPAGAGAPGVSWTALVLVLVGALVFVGGGVALIVYCLSGGPEQPPQALPGGEPTSPTAGGPAGGNPANPPAPRPSQPLSRLSREQQTRVDQAVGRALAYLRSTQKADGTWPADNVPANAAGLTALAGLTLLECGAARDDPQVRKVADYLRGREASPNKLANTYDVSLAVLFFDRLDDAQDRGLIRKLALRLVSWQTPGGGWSYNRPILSDADTELLASLLEENKGQLSADLAASKLELKAVDPAKLRLPGNKPVPGQLAGLPVWRNDTWAVPDSDNSNTQFAVLALWAAKTRGVPVERTLALVVARFHKAQNPNGSWGYEIAGWRKATNGAGQPPGAMTCSGLLGLAVGQGLVNEARARAPHGSQAAPRQDPAIRRGLDFLGRHVGDPHQPWGSAAAAPLVDLYYLWSVERVGVIFNLARMGGKDWYAWGAEKLVANQKIDGERGYWENGGYYGQAPVVNTCFGLLFLKQANLAKDLTAKLALAD